MPSLTPVPKIQFFDANGNPLVGGRLYSYAAGTTTPRATYVDEAGSAANTNPVILDSRGEANVWLDTSSYKLRLTDPNGVEIWTVDNISAAAGGGGSGSANASFTAERQVATAGQSVFFLTNAYVPGAQTLSVFINGIRMTDVVDYTETSSTTVTFTGTLSANDEVVFTVLRFATLAAADSANVTYYPAGVSTPRTAQAKLRETVSVKDFGAVGDGVADDTAALKAAFDYSIPLGVTVEMEGSFKISGPIQPYATLASGGLHILCKGKVNIIVDAAASGFSDVLYFHTTAYNSASIVGGNLSIDGSNKAARGITIRHDAVDNGQVNISANLEIKNILNTDASDTRENQALSIYGRYTQVNIERPYIQGVNRTNAAGATKGIVVAALGGVCTINQPYVENVLCVSSANADADGIAVFGYQAGGASSARQGTLIVNEPTFINCQGRSFKGQISDVVIYRPRVRRTGAVVAIQQGVDFDFQFSGDALLHEPVYEYYETGGVSPFSVAGSSFTCVTFQQTLDDREMAGRSVGGTMYTQVQLPRYASIVPGATAKESTCQVTGLRVLPVGAFALSAFIRAILEVNATNIVAKSSKTKIEISDVKGPVQCYGIGYTNYTSGALTSKLSITVTDLTNTLGVVSAARPFAALSGSTIVAVESFTFKNLNGFRDLMPSGWTFTFNQLQSGTSFSVDIATVVATGAPGWGVSGYAFIECVGGGYFGATDKNIKVYKDNATAASTVFYTRDGGAAWGTIK